jgi:hypothetical protein
MTGWNIKVHFDKEAGSWAVVILMPHAGLLSSNYFLKEESSNYLFLRINPVAMSHSGAICASHLVHNISLGFETLGSTSRKLGFRSGFLSQSSLEPGQIGRSRRPEITEKLRDLLSRFVKAFCPGWRLQPGQKGLRPFKSCWHPFCPSSWAGI